MKPLSDAEADKLVPGPGIRGHAPRCATGRTERCDGIPLFIEKVWNPSSKSNPPIPPESARVPDTLYEALFARLRSSTNALLVVEAAALIGSRVDRRLPVNIRGRGWARARSTVCSSSSGGRGGVLAPVGQGQLALSP